MPETGTAEGKIPYIANEVVTITDGQPDKPEVCIDVDGTVQFVNTDERNWQIRLFTRDREQHPDVDQFLPSRSAITVIVDPETIDGGDCRYEILTSRFALKESKAMNASKETDTKGNSSSGKSTSGVGNTGEAVSAGVIIIRPTPK
jgi:hypothetical protein